jgi:hypothetical protein
LLIVPGVVSLNTSTSNVLVTAQSGLEVYRRTTVIVLVSDKSPGANATATLNVAELAFEDPTVTPPPPLNTYCVVPPKVSVAGLGSTILNELLLQI